MRTTLRPLFGLMAASFLLSALVSCESGPVLIPAESFDGEAGGGRVELCTINGGGLTAQITNYGARVVSLWVPDRKGRLADVVLGHDSLAGYLPDAPGERFLGSCPGPVANRIAGASFELDGKIYELEANDGPNTLHGGFTGLDRRCWEIRERSDSSLLMSVLHPDGDGGFPGNKSISVRYTLTSTSALKVEFLAETDAPTPMSLAHHPFFNLRGEGNGDILGHVLTINASRYTPVGEGLIPTGEIASVSGTPLDFRRPRRIGDAMHSDDDQVRIARGFDHNWVIDRGAQREGSLVPAAYLFEPESGRFLEVLSDQPGLQFYSGFFFNDGQTFCKDGSGPLPRYAALVFETQKFPDALHNPAFPDIILRPGQTYSHTCLYRFSVKK